MAADPTETIANSVASYLTTQSSGFVESFTATAPDQPTVDREDGGVKVQVVPAAPRHEKITRGGKTLDIWAVRILVTDDLDDGREQDSQLVNEIRQSLKGQSQSGYTWANVQTEVHHDQAHLRERNQFTAVLLSEYTGIS